MANDFLSKVAKDANKAIKANDSSPYRLKKEGSKTAQIRNNTYKTVKLIAFEQDRKMIDVFDDLIKIGLNDPRYKKYVN
ncbi:hypothetical protein B5G22_09420 [Limosilactobacillus reuteri]|mgnify:CR=1 FL=1|uniref:Uncharacterized protein n=1 Tax=Limosilactobacillus reuteri TaxID=1598 RepID=A0A1Y4NZT8_LIMRT|nr:hypothetical protein [Limosilactobacillus reuteri]OUN44686.1 hypothetical protein B5G22_09420 [Limosilactobacillus reuteri]OUP86285.1 hypothetical protein B5F04_09650 [Limosilactobacillus reuteri]